jgi:hypothetical protein
MLSLLAIVAAGCTSGPHGVRFLDSSQPSKPAAQPIRTLSADEIKLAITGKTFQYTRSDGNGFITYNGDGSFSFQDDVKGPGKGAWTITNNQFCESFNGSAMDCGDFTSTGDAYFAAKSRLVEMKG